MRERGRGGVVNVASVAAFVPRGTYGASQGVGRAVHAGRGEGPGRQRGAADGAVPGFVRTEFHERAGMGTDNIPGWMWLDADKLVAAALDDLARGQVAVHPRPALQGADGRGEGDAAGLLGGISSRTGRKYGPQ